MKIIDNINQLLGDDLKNALSKGAKLKIAASCFSIYAFEALRDELETIDELQFVFTSPTFTPNEATDRLRRERREFHIPKAARERSFYGTEFEIQLKNKLTQKAIARECANWLRAKAVFKSNASAAPMQQFACVENQSDTTAYMPLQGFTAVDLGYYQGDAVSNIVNKFEDESATGTYLNLFNQIWNDQEQLEDVTDYLCDHIASVYQENSPEQIYFLMLYNIFNEFLDDISEDVLPNDMTGYQDTEIWRKLFSFQRDAATGIINKLETFNGCILADSVGLGKTFTALAVIKYYELRNRAVLVLCPKKLADNWLTYNRNLKTNIVAGDRLNYDVLCHTDLLRTSGDSFGTPLNRINWGNYDLVVIDESHNFRNDNAVNERETRYEKLMNSVVKDGVKTKVLMLTATPVNNRFMDLRNQLALAYEGDREEINKKLRTSRDIDEIFKRAQSAFNTWSKLPAEQRTAEAILNALDFDFFELLDSVTIARSRRHIETFYDMSEIGSFPKRRPPESIHWKLTDREDVIEINEIFLELQMISMAVYAPVKYILKSRIAKYEEMYDQDVREGKGKLRQADREKSLQRLMTINLLKRLESSVEAFRLTLKTLKKSHLETLEKIDAFHKGGTDTNFTDTTGSLDDLDQDEVLNPSDAMTGGKIKISLSDMDTVLWEANLKADLEIIIGLLEQMEKIAPEDDAKLQMLIAQIEHKIESPFNPGNQKVLLFTAFADTANYLYSNVAEHLRNKFQIHSSRVSGSDSPKSTIGKSYDFQSLLTLFSPLSKEKASILADESEEIDLLIGTDCISEGQNLQDCDMVINYDIHWNPVRIIQRFGRIDRIGSVNETIQLVNYWPDITLDAYIHLKERVENRMVIADVTATADDNVLVPEVDEDVSYRKEQLRRLQDEVIEMEDLKTGVSITDLGLNDFRMDLLNYVKKHGDLASIPSGMHAVVEADPTLGLDPGVIFTLRNRHDAVNPGGHNRLHPYYLIYMANDGEVITDYTEIKKLLDLARRACKGHEAHIAPLCKAFNSATDDGRDMRFYSELLDVAIRSIIDTKEGTDIDSLFTGSRTTALVDTIAGLDDFELLSFLVVYEKN